MNAIERDLRHHFHAEYRIMKAASGAQALDAVRHLKQRGAAIALFLVDERMPGMTGTQFLIEALKLYPCRRVLLTAYADTEVAITAINKIGLDHYLLKPWEPPEQRLYPVLDDLLAEWMARTRPPFEGIRVAGTALSASSYAVKDFLSRNLIPYQWVDLDSDAPARELVQSTADGMSRLPFVMFQDGTTMVQPTPRQLAEKIGMQTRPQRPFYDLVVIGGGPAGLAAAVYGASEGCGQSSWNATRQRTGRYQLTDRELPWVSERDLGRRSRASRHRPGQAVRSRDRIGAGRHLHSPQRPLPCSCPLGRFGAELLRSARGVWHGSATTRGAGRG